MRSAVPALALGCVAIAFAVGGACSFPDPTVDPADGSGGNPTGTTTTLAGTTTSTTQTAPASSGATTTGNGGGGAASTSDSPSSSSTSDGGGGSAPSSSSEGGATTTSSSSEGGGTLTGVGGGVVDLACDNGCVPYPSDSGGGGAGGVGGNGSGGSRDDDCDDDEDPNLTDCQPCDPLVHHRQPEYFDVAFMPFEERASPSFDYDCSGSPTTEYDYFPFGCDDVPVNSCDDVTIYVLGDDPVCGESHTTQDCHQTGIVVVSCSPDGAASSMLVRCH